MKKVILVAEDDMDDRFLLETAFGEFGDEVELRFVDNGVAVFDYLESRVDQFADHGIPELIILDLNMPKKNGKEVLEELRQHPIFNKIPVIVYTTTNNQLEVRKCYELGANTYIVKPSNFQSLRNIVQSIRTYWLSTASIPELT